MNTQAAAHSALYVPVHKRSASRGNASSTSSTDSASSRSVTPTSEHESSIGMLFSSIDKTELGADHVPESHRLPVYSIQDMLMLSKSPLVTFSPDHRDYLRDTIPEIVLSRKQRKAIEHRQHSKPHASAGETPSKETLARKPLSPMSNSQPAVQITAVRQGRFSEKRRNSKKIVDELSWRVPRTRTISMADSPVLFVPTTVA